MNRTDPKEPKNIGSQGGCAAKLSGMHLTALLAEAYGIVFGKGAAHPMMAPFDSARLEVGNDVALMTSVDLMPLFGFDPEATGRIAALHSMSDIFATGGTPRWAMPILVVSMRETRHAIDVLTGLLRTCKEEDVSIAGGHTTTGRDTYVGLSVIGTAPRGRALAKRGGRVGDRLFLSKPVGTGLVLHAVTIGALPRSALDSAYQTMLVSNRAAASAAANFGATASTDVSGYGLLGHLAEMLGDKLGARINSSAVPVLPLVGTIPSTLRHAGAIRANRDYVNDRVPLAEMSDLDRLAPLLDPQTNGGLLIAASAESAQDLEASGYVEIGELSEDVGITIDWELA